MSYCITALDLLTDPDKEAVGYSAAIPSFTFAATLTSLTQLPMRMPRSRSIEAASARESILTVQTVTSPSAERLYR